MDISNSQGFVANGSAVEAASRRAEQAVGRKLSNKASTRGKNKLSGIAVAEGGTLVARTGEEKRIDGLRKFQRRSDMVWNLDLAGMVGGGALSWAAMKAGSLRARTVIKAVLNAPIEALRATSLNQLHMLPTNYMRIVGDYAHESAVLKIAQQQVPKAERTFNPLKMWKNSSERKEAIAKVVKNIELETADLSGIKGAEGARKLANNVAGRAASMEASGVKFGEAVATKTSGVTAPIKDSVKRGLTSLESTGFGRGVESISHRLPNWKIFSKMKGEGLTGIASSLKRGLGNSKLFGAIIIAGAAAGATATVLNAKKESKEAKAALAEMATDIGDANSPLIESIRQTYASQKTKRRFGTTMMAGGELFNGVLFSSSDGLLGGNSMMPAIGLSMMLPMAGQALVSDNAGLNAYKNLKLVDSGKLTLKPEERVNLVKYLVAAVPSVAAHGGEYNRLTGPVAEEIAAKNLSARDTVKLLADNTKFTALAAAVAEKQKAVKAAAPVKETVASTKDHALHQDATHSLAQSAMASDSHGGHLAASPATKVSSVVAHGKVAASQHQAATV